MLEPLPDLPEGVIGFEAVGRIHADDYTSRLIPAIEHASTHGGIRLVYVLGDRFEGYTAGGACQDVKLGLHHHGNWKRCALLTDAEWVIHVAQLLGWMVPGEVTVFPLDQHDEALAWVATEVTAPTPAH
jgi:hypothetical protein